MFTEIAFLFVLKAASLFLSSTQLTPNSVTNTTNAGPPISFCPPPRPICLDGTVFDPSTCGCKKFPPVD
jgi:hypothetical protein